MDVEPGKDTLQTRYPCTVGTEAGELFCAPTCIELSQLNPSTAHPGVRLLDTLAFSCVLGSDVNPGDGCRPNLCLTVARAREMPSMQCRLPTFTFPASPGQGQTSGLELSDPTLAPILS